MDIPTVLNISRTNGLGPQDRSAFDSLGKQCQERIPLLHKKIDDTEKLLASLKKDLYEMEQGVLLCRSLTTPSHIRCLPAELLALIFTFTCAGDVFHVFPGENKKPPPACLSLIRVCKYWRDLAFGTKVIWDHFVVVRPSQNDIDERSGGLTSMKKVVELYGRNLTRLHMDYLYWIGNFDEEFLAPMFSTQGQLVSLTLLGSQVFDFIDTLTMPRLEELFLHGQVSRRQSRKEGDLMKFNTPSLKRVFVCFPEADVSINNIPFPWHQISHLSLGSPCTLGQGMGVLQESLFSLLMQLPHLEYLHLSQLPLLKSTDDDQEPPSRARLVVTHEHLQHIDLYDPHLGLLAYTEEDDNLFSRISMPFLQKFDYSFSLPEPYPLDDEMEALEGAFIPFFQRTPSLRQVRLVSRENDDTSTSPWFRQPIPASGRQFTGKTAFFALLSSMITEDEDYRRIVGLSTKRMVPKEGWLNREEVWTDRLIDRYINQLPIIPLEGHTIRDEYAGEDDSSQSRADEEVEEFEYGPNDRSTMRALFTLLGDERIPDHIERHVYLGF